MTCGTQRQNKTSNVITRIEAKRRHRQRYEWLDTYYLFSFANYVDPSNLEFGTLRVFNDDRINTYSGFDEHSHDNMEIVTIMLDGRLTHRDSLGNVEMIKAGEVQRMSAGTGVVHAEKNLDDEPVHLYQLWFYPHTEGLIPSYVQADFSYIEPNTFVPIVSNQPMEGALSMSADATIYRADLEASQSLSYVLQPERGLFVYVEAGELKISDQVFEVGDQARISSESHVTFKTEQGTKFVCIDVGRMK